MKFVAKVFLEKLRLKEPVMFKTFCLVVGVMLFLCGGTYFVYWLTSTEPKVDVGLRSVTAAVLFSLISLLIGPLLLALRAGRTLTYLTFSVVMAWLITYALNVSAKIDPKDLALHQEQMQVSWGLITATSLMLALYGAQRKPQTSIRS